LLIRISQSSAIKYDMTNQITHANATSHGAIKIVPFDPQRDMADLMAMYAERNSPCPPARWLPIAGCISAFLDEGDRTSCTNGAPLALSPKARFVGFYCVWLTSSGRAFLDEACMVKGLSKQDRQRLSAAMLVEVERCCRLAGAQHLSTTTALQSCKDWLVSAGFKSVSKPDQEMFCKTLLPTE
jgi:hypothetical protein